MVRLIQSSHSCFNKHYIDIVDSPGCWSTNIIQSCFAGLKGHYLIINYISITTINHYLSESKLVNYYYLTIYLSSLILKTIVTINFRKATYDHKQAIWVDFQLTLPTLFQLPEPPNPNHKKRKKMKKNSLNKYKEKSLKSIHVEVIISGSDMHLTSHLLFVHISILILIQFLICVDGLYYRMWIMDSSLISL